MKPFLILQLRPEDAASDGEYEAFLKGGRLTPEQTRRVRMERESIPPINLDDYSGVIIGGGPYNVSDPEEKKPPEQKRFEAELDVLLEDLVARDFPFMGACYGIGILARHLGGVVSRERYGEPVGGVTVLLTEEAETDPLTQGLPEEFRAFAGHKEACQEVPPGAVLLGVSEVSPVQMIRFNKNMYATQFHTELDKEGIAVRINIYRNAGYFPPEDADKLIAETARELVTIPEQILQRFVTRYSAVR